MTISGNPLTLLLLLPWTALWLAGGVLLAWGAFRLRPNEVIIAGLAVGWLVQVWLANLLCLVLPVPLASWLSAAGVFLAGAFVALRVGWRRLERPQISLPQLLILAAITYIFFSAARGLAIFDDFAHLPTVSLMAAGDVPPHFALDGQVRYGYHHFLLLFSAQLIRLGGLSPWWALDAGRAVAFGLAVMLSALFARRLTRSRLAGMLGGLAVAFGSGARWLLLLAPPAVVSWLGRHVELIGSGAGSGASLSEALVNFWAVEGAGPIGFPFGFANGVFPAGVTAAHGANGLANFMVIFLLLMTFNRWRSPAAAVVTAVLISIWGLLGEAELPLIAAGWGLVCLAWIIANRSLRLPRSLLAWLGVAAAGCLIGLLEGGAWTDILMQTAARMFGQDVGSYQTIGFEVGAPVLVSSHLGVLPVTHPATLLVALAELGPVLLVLPLLVAWGWKAFRIGRWYESATAATVVVSLLMLFVRFSGSTGVRNTPRLYVFIPLLLAFAVPLTLLFVERRSSAVKMAAAGLGLVMIFGGLVFAGFQMIAVQRPVYSYFLTPLDVQMTRAHWNRLEAGALVFDPVPYRAPAIFARHTNASYTWYHPKPEWEALLQAPDPRRLRAAGFRYLYVDKGYWDSVDPNLRAAYSGGCAVLVDDVSDALGDFRRLFDLQNCR